MGKAGEKSIQRIESASQLASARLQIVSKAANDAFAQMEDATSRLGLLGTVLGKLGHAGLIAGGLPQIGVFSRANSRNTQADTASRCQEQLDEVAWQLNTRPRKSMGFKCPAEMFTPDAFDFKQHHASLFALAA